MKSPLSLGLLLLTLLSSLVATQAQGPGIPVERNGKQDEAVLTKAKTLMDAGKLKLSISVVKAQLTSPQPGHIELPAARTQSLTGREIAKAARESHIMLGWYYRCPRCDKWHTNLAAAYVIATDAIATCHHCVQPNDDMREGFLIAVDFTGEVIPVTSILAKSETADGALLRLEGAKLTPLPFNDQISPGDAAYCYSAPLGQSGYFSDGIVNRFYWRGAPGKPNGNNAWKNLRLNVSTDWAPGSSGAAVLDQSANVIGHVSTIQPLREGLTLPEADDKSDDKKRRPKTDRFGGATLITLHDATPARAMLALAKPLRDFNPATPVALEKPEYPEVSSVLKVGAPAPALKTGKWLQGEAIQSFEKGKIYIVEFWATWCGPCRVTIPHLNELHKKFADKGVIVIGQDVWEQDSANVAPFIKEMGDKMTYRVALDSVDGNDPNQGTMATTWMQAANQRGIPTAFVVAQNGTIAWIGHPGQLKESMLSELIDGKFDLAKSKATSEESEKTRDAMMRHGTRAARAISQKDWDAAQQATSAFEDALPATKKYIAEVMRFKIALGKSDTSAANESARKIGATADVESTTLNEIAWDLLTSKALEKPDLELAEKLARRSVATASETERAPNIDTLARALFRLGKKEDAIKQQEQSIAGAADATLKASLQKTLEAYQRGELPAE